MSSILAETAHSTAVHVIERDGRASHCYLRSQGRNVGAALAAALTNLESLLNTTIACDVACGVVNVLTVGRLEGDDIAAMNVDRSRSAEPTTSVDDGDTEHDRNMTAPSSLPSFGAFWDPALVGMSLPLTSDEGAILYSMSEESNVGIQGVGTVRRLEVRKSHELLLTEYARFVSDNTKATPEEHMIQSINARLMSAAARTSGEVPPPPPPRSNNEETLPNYPLTLPPTILNFQFPEAVEDIRQKLCPLSPHIRVVPYKVVTYGMGDYFLPHVDSMDYNPMQFGSLALQLPYALTSGDLSGGLHDVGSDDDDDDGASKGEVHTLASGELVFYVGREDNSTIQNSVGNDDDDHFRNHTWANYGRPRGDDEQLRMRVDLTTTLPSTNVEASAVAEWLNARSGVGCQPSSAPSHELGDAQFKVQPLKYAAWQGDIPHEVTRVTTAFRTVILYRLVKVFLNKPTQPMDLSKLSFLSDDSLAALSKLDGEGVIAPFPTSKLTFDDADDDPSDNDQRRRNKTLWDRFSEQTAALRAYRSLTYTALIPPTVRTQIQQAVLEVTSYMDPPAAASAAASTRPEKSRGGLSRFIKYLWPQTPPSGPTLSHIGFVMRHQYAPAVLRILHELQSPTSNHARSLSQGTRRRLIISLLKGSDAVLFAVLTEMGQVSVHAAHQVRSDYASTTFRKTSSSDSTFYGPWVQRVFLTPVTLASHPVVPNANGDNATGVVHIEKAHDLNRESSADEVGNAYPCVVDSVWATMGLGRLLGGGQTFGNCDCGSDWWYRMSVMMFNPNRGSSFSFRHNLLMLALRKRTPDVKNGDAGVLVEVAPIVKILRALLECPDVFGRVAAFL